MASEIVVGIDFGTTLVQVEAMCTELTTCRKVLRGLLGSQCGQQEGQLD